MNADQKPAKKRARKTSTVPTRIYSYGCEPPVTEVGRVDDQYRLAAQYRNVLVEIEHWLREQIRKAQLAHATIGPALRLFEEAQRSVDEAYVALRAAKSGTPNPALAAPLAVLTAVKARRKEAYGALREAKRASAEDTGILADYTAARTAAASRRKTARGDYSARGLRHGAYARVEDAVRQAAGSTKRPLKFKRYDGSGSIGTQLTETGKGVRKSVDPDVTAVGMTWRELISCADPRLRLGMPGAFDRHPRPEVTALAGLPAADAWTAAQRLPRNLRCHAARTWVDVRIGTNTDRSPIFARFPVMLHRLPPPDCVIKWAHVVRRRIGHQLEWRFQLTLESKTFDRPPAAIGTGLCAVNLGWRRLFDDQGEVIGLRAAYMVDEDGREREIRVPDYVARHGDRRTYAVLSAVGKIDDLAQIRDKALEVALRSLSAWITARDGVPTEWDALDPPRSDGSVPRPMVDRLRGYATWRSQRKLQSFINGWKQHRVDGDGAILEALFRWSTQDLHLERWQSDMRDRLVAHRRETWRVIATELARTYATILVGASRLVDIEGWEQPDPEDGDPSDGRLQRRMARIAAPGELLAEIVKAAAKTGGEVRRVDDVRATRVCHACGHDEPWDAAPSVDHTCEGCGKSWDQDANHGRNLIARARARGPVLPAAEGPVAARTSRKATSSGAAVGATLAKHHE